MKFTDLEGNPVKPTTKNSMDFVSLRRTISLQPGGYNFPTNLSFTIPEDSIGILTSKQSPAVPAFRTLPPGEYDRFVLSMVPRFGIGGYRVAEGDYLATLYVIKPAQLSAGRPAKAA